MKKTILSFCLLAVFALFFVSCSDDDNSTNNNSESSSLLPLKTGNYWIYDYWDLDATNQAVESSHTVDSVYVEKDTTLYNYAAYKYVSVSNGSKSITCLRTDNAKVYASESFFVNISQLGLPIDASQFDLPHAWYLIADNNATSTWTLFSKSVDNLQFNGISFTANLNITGKKGNSFAVTFNGINYTAQNFVITYSVKIGSASMVLFDLTYDNNYAFIKGIGFYKVNSDYKKVNVPLSQPYEMFGTLTQLLRYQLK